MGPGFRRGDECWRFAIEARMSDSPGMEPALTFAIGDIHGCHRALLHLLDLISDHAKGRACRLVFIGDYIDRGPDSRSVIETVRTVEQRNQSGVICLMGNHEELLLEAIDSGDASPWLGNGGAATLLSYGIRDPARIPAADIAFLRSLRLTFDDGKRFFVHAGIDPGHPLDQQPRQALLWIRERFLRASTYHGRLIVHGHTPREDARPEVRHNRVNIDTACVYGGVLTAAVFTDKRVAPIGFLSARER